MVINKTTQENQMSFLQYIFQDWKVNHKELKSRFVLVLFRIAQQFRKLPKKISWFSVPYLIFYRIFVEWFLGIELKSKTKIGTNFTLFHGIGLVINDNTIIGKNCSIRHCTTIGNKKLRDGSNSDCPHIGDNVTIGPNSIIIGPIKIGNFAIIGAGSVVVKDVPDYAVVAGNPAKVIRTNKIEI